MKQFEDSEDRLIWAQRIGKIGDWILNTKSWNISWSRTTYDIYDRHPKDGTPTYEEILKFCKNEDAEILDRDIKNLIKHGKPYEHDLQIFLPSGNMKYIHSVGMPSKYSKNKVIEISGIVQDITTRKQAEIDLRNSEERYKILVDSAQHSIMTLRPPTWKFTSGNPKVIEMFGVKDIDEFVSLGPWDLSPEFQPDGIPSSEKAAEMIKNAMRNGTHFFEWTHTRKDTKESFPATVNLSKVDTADDQFLLATVVDITEVKKNQRALKESEERLRIVADHSLDWEMYMDSDGKLNYINPAFENITGYKMAQYESEEITYKDIVHPDDLKEVSKVRKNALNGISIKNFRHRIITKDKREIYVSVNSQSVKDDKGNLLGIRMNIRDVDEPHTSRLNLKEREEALHKIIKNTANYEGDEYFNRMVKNLREIINADTLFIGKINSEKDKVQTIALSNRDGSNKNFIYDLKGSPCERVINNQTNVYVTGVANLYPNDIALVKKSIQGYIGSPIFGYKGEGIGLIVALYKQPIQNSPLVTSLFELFAVGIGAEMVRNETVELLKKSEEQLITSEQNLKAVFESTDNIIALFDLNSKLLAFNDSFARIIKGRDNLDLKIGMDLSQIKRPHVQIFENYLIEAKKGKHIKEIVEYKSDLGTKYIQLSYNPILKNKKVIAISMFVEDITELKTAIQEKDILFKELHHRVKNNLQLILSFLYMKSQNINPMSLEALLKDLEFRIISISRIHENLLRSNKINELDISDYLEELVRSIVKSYAEKNNVEVKVTAPFQILPIDIALNLGLITNEIVSNSMKHAFKKTDNGLIELTFNKKGDRSYELIIADNGVGFPKGFNFKKSESTGIELIRVFANQLEGTIELNQKNKTQFRINFDI